MPTPRKLRLDSVKMAEPTPSVAATMTTGITPGNMWRTMVRRALAPRALAATTSARTWRAVPIQLVSAMNRMTSNSDTLFTAAKARMI